MATLFLSRVPREGEEGDSTADRGRAVPVPVMDRQSVELLLGVEGFEGFDSVSGMKRRLGTKGRTMTGMEVSRALSESREVYALLPFESSAREAAVKVAEMRGGDGFDFGGFRVGMGGGGGMRISTALDALATLVGQARCSLERLEVNEAETLSPPGGAVDSVTLCCSIVLRRESSAQKLYGEAVYDDDEISIIVPLPMGIALASHLDLPTWLPRSIWRVGFLSLVLFSLYNILCPVLLISAPLSFQCPNLFPFLLVLCLSNVLIIVLIIWSPLFPTS